MKNEKRDLAFDKIDHVVLEVLTTYANVHRGSGHFSMATTELYEHARKVVLDFVGRPNKGHVVIFSSALKASKIIQSFFNDDYILLDSRDYGLALGVVALIVDRRKLPSGDPVWPGGGTALLFSPGWVIWVDAPDRYEAGTPPVVNIIAFVRALQMIRKEGEGLFHSVTSDGVSPDAGFSGFGTSVPPGFAGLDPLRTMLLGRNIQVPTFAGEKRFVNLDNSASTPALKPVMETFLQALRMSAGNQAAIIEETRQQCAKFLGTTTDEYDVIFTSNTTEAINLAAENLLHTLRPQVEPVILSTYMEHSSNDLPWRGYPQFSMVRVSYDEEGFPDVAEIERLVSEYNEQQLHGNQRIVLIAVTAASNILAASTDIDRIGLLANKAGVPLLADGAQIVAHRPVRLTDSGIGFFAFSAHKIYAPFGCGVLMVRRGLMPMSAEFRDKVKASGESNAAGIAALGKALVLLQQVGMETIMAEEHRLTKALLTGLTAMQGLKLFGQTDPGAPRFNQRGGIVIFEQKGRMAGATSLDLATQGAIGVRFGCHCAHILIKRLLKFTPFLEWFQGVVIRLFPHLQLQGVVRVSLGIGNTDEDVERFLATMQQITNAKAGKSANQSPQSRPISAKAKKKLLSDFAARRITQVFD
jgi:selenocysteine lyase/cysteine desulfurase